MFSLKREITVHRWERYAYGTRSYGTFKFLNNIARPWLRYPNSSGTWLLFFFCLSETKKNSSTLAEIAVQCVPKVPWLFRWQVNVFERRFFFFFGKWSSWKFQFDYTNFKNQKIITTFFSNLLSEKFFIIIRLTFF